MMINTKSRVRAFSTGAALMLVLVACSDEETPVDEAAEADVVESVGPPAESPWTGSLARGIRAMEEHADEEEYGAALLVANRMMEPDELARFRRRLERRTRGVSESVLRPITRALDAVGIDALSEADRAEVEFARALVLARAASEDADLDGVDPALASEKAFERARAAGGGARADAIAALGALDLVEGEVLRLQVPEIAQAMGGPSLPQDADDGAPDPLVEARKAYVRARDHFVERLRMESDPGAPERKIADVRADVELTIRRLRELDAIEQDRQDQSREDQQDQEGDEQNENEENKDKDKENEDKGEKSESEKDDENANQEEEGEEPPPDDAPPEENDPGEEDDEESEDQESGEEEKPGEEQENEESESQEDEQAPEDQQAEQQPEISEEQMTMEELKRLFDQRREYEKEGERRRKALRIKRKIPTQRDW